MNLGTPNFSQQHNNRREHQKIKCTKCGGECKTLSAMISEDEQEHIRSVECLKCGHTETVRTARLGAPKQVEMIV